MKESEKGITTNKKKEFWELSDIAQFHTAPKLFGENAQHPFYDYDAEIREIRTDILEVGSSLNKTPEQISTPEGEHLKKVIQTVLSVKLNDDAKNDPEEKRKLALCKKKIKEYLNKVLNLTEEYLGTILALDEAAKGGVNMKLKWQMIGED